MKNVAISACKPLQACVAGHGWQLIRTPLLAQPPNGKQFKTKQGIAKRSKPQVWMVLPILSEPIASQQGLFRKAKSVLKTSCPSGPVGNSTSTTWISTSFVCYDVHGKLKVIRKENHGLEALQGIYDTKSTWLYSSHIGFTWCRISWKACFHPRGPMATAASSTKVSAAGRRLRKCLKLGVAARNPEDFE